jgi:hypothetical protein
MWRFFVLGRFSRVVKRRTGIFDILLFVIPWGRLFCDMYFCPPLPACGRQGGGDRLRWGWIKMFYKF